MSRSRESIAPARGALARRLVLWVPDWPIVAWFRAADSSEEADDPATAGLALAGFPLAVVAKGMVVACSAAARSEGVRVGQRRRDAQARCPQVQIVAEDVLRDHRAFAPVVAAIEELAPGVQVIRPGLCALDARGPARYYGSEAAAATVLVGAVSGWGIDDARVGIAEGTFTAEQAARRGTNAQDPMRIVPPGQAAAFLAPLPVTVLEDDTVDLFGRLGVQTLGQVAALGAERLAERFGARGARLFALTSGGDPRPLEARTPPPELHREVAFEPAVEIADQVAFAFRLPAEEFTAALGQRGWVCTALRVILTGERGDRSERVWLHPGAFDAAAIVDRVRWQLAERQVRSAVVRARIDPEEVDAAAHHTARLFGSGPEERVHHALSRVQAMLGHRGVLRPEIGGGRWLAERQQLVAWGDRAPGHREGAQKAEAAPPWPGHLPDPLPATVFAEAMPVEVLDTDGDMVAVDGRGMPTAEPAQIVRGGTRRGVQGWTGPWPVFERSWDPARARAAHRFQLVDSAGVAWLLVCEEGMWQVEGVYD